MFKQMKMVVKLGVGFGVTFVLSLGVCIFFLHEMGLLTSFTEKMYNHPFMVTNAILRADGYIVRMHRSMKDVVLSKDAAGIADAAGKVDENEKEVYKNFDVIGERFLGDKALLEDAKQAFADWKLIRSEVIDLMKQGKTEEAIAITKNKGAAQVAKVNEKIRLLDDYAQNKAKSIYGASQETKSSAFIWSYVLMFVTGALCIVLIVSITSSITKPLSQLIPIIGEVEKGNFDVIIENESSDEIGHLSRAMDLMISKFRDIVCNIRTASDTIASSSQQLSASSGHMTQGIVEQSERATQIATSTTQMSQTVNDISQNTANIASSTSDTLKVAKEGEVVVAKTVNEVNAIASTVSESANLISSLGERSKEIGNIVNVINDIADQTNLLALNAAIEAARAGEQGRGFAVVADEVRKLAERTAKSTSEISEMINAIQHEIVKAVSSMDEAMRRVDIGVQDVTQSGETLRSVVMNVEQLQSMIQQIAASTDEMSTVAESISSDTDTIANVSRETSSSSEEVASSASSLAKLSSDLQQLVRMFSVGECKMGDVGKRGQLRLS
ncbi:MAG: methyl-accepting chemotaxis protein [Nitrospirae bacterium]|nr:methyl-accepting chemotaxis protein [Nitrospirota bacterium]